MKKDTVELTAAQREALSHMISTGQAVARELTHARLLLKADQGPDGPGWSDSQIAEVLESSVSTVARVCKRCAERGVQEAILPAQASAMRKRRLDGSGEAYLIALVCRTPPEGCVRWTLRLLAHQLVELGDAEKMVLVMDHLTTHTLAALYEVFAIKEARRLCQRFEVHSTPTQASWLTMAEIERIARWIGHACRNGWPPWRSQRGRSLPGPLGATSSR